MVMKVMLAVLVAVGPVSAAYAQGDSILVSGQSTIGMIDGDNDGPDYGDCQFTAMLFAGSFLQIASLQDANFPLRACSGGYSGTGGLGADSSSNFISAFLNSSSINPHAHELPLSVTAFQEVPNPNGEPPVVLSKLIDGIELFDGETLSVVGAAALCSAGGAPAARITLDNGMQILRAGSISDGFLKLPGIPVERALPHLGEFVLRDAYIPTNDDGTVSMALASAPDSPLLILDLNALQACATAVAPVASAWALAAMLLSLLAVTVWRLRGRPAFSQMLPRI